MNSQSSPTPIVGAGATVSRVFDRPFNPSRRPRSPAATELVNEVARLLQNYEDHFGVRKRKRKADDQVTFETTVSAVLCDLVHFHLTGGSGAIHVTRSNQELGTASRYRSPALNKRLPHVLDLLAAPEMAFLVQKVGADSHLGNRRRTTISPSARLVRRIVGAGIDVGDLRVAEDHETIQLKSEKGHFWDEANLLEYDDSELTVSLRTEMAAINRWLDGAAIEFDPIVQKSAAANVDHQQRWLRRVFTRGSFDCGGRLWGGFWLDLSHRERMNGLTMNGEPVVELDYGQMSVRIAYGMVGGTPTFTDAYQIAGFERHRAGIKRVLNSMLFATKRLARMPKGVRKELEQRHTIGGVMSAIEAAHEPIRSLFFNGVGHRTQRVESDILVEVLLALRDDGTPALPIHDAILVPASRADAAERAMLAIGHPCDVSVTGLTSG